MFVKSLARGLAALTLAAAAIVPAQAGVIDFEGVTPEIFSGTAITVGDFRFESDAFGFSAVTDAPSFAFGNAPPNSQGQFLAMLQNDGMVMSRTDGAAFRLVGLDFAFLAPLPGLGLPGASAGELTVIAELANGQLGFETILFPAADANGDFGFASSNLGSLFGEAITAIGFFGCIYTATGCSFSALDIPAQFAIDNIKVPEPSAAALALLALGLAAATRRRRSV